MEYIVAVRLSVPQLVEEVNELINDGWQPHGSLAVDGTESNVEYLQPMVKYTVSSTTIEGEFEPIKETFTTTGIKDNEFDVSNVPITP